MVACFSQIPSRVARVAAACPRQLAQTEITKTRKIHVVNILSPVQTCSDEYNNGTATELMLEMISEREVEAKRRTIQFLARNNSLMIPCEHGEKMLLPLVNPPRVGMCGYTGQDLVGTW
jgi:hypothetical protein